MALSIKGTPQKVSVLAGQVKGVSMGAAAQQGLKAAQAQRPAAQEKPKNGKA